MMYSSLIPFVNELVKLSILIIIAPQGTGQGKAAKISKGLSGSIHTVSTSHISTIQFGIGM